MLVPHLLKIYLALVSSNDINHQNRKKILKLLKTTENKETKNILKQKFGWQMDVRETNSDYEMGKR